MDRKNDPRYISVHDGGNKIATRDPFSVDYVN